MKVIIRNTLILLPDEEGMVPDLGMGPGVVGWQEAVFEDVDDPTAPPFLQSMLRFERDTIRHFVQVQSEIAFEDAPPERVDQWMTYFTQPEPDQDGDR